MRISVYFSERGAKEGLPWMLSTSTKRYQASSVDFLVKSWTEERTERATDPKYFHCCDGRLTWRGTKAIIREGGK